MIISCLLLPTFFDREGISIRHEKTNEIAHYTFLLLGDLSYQMTYYKGVSEHSFYLLEMNFLPLYLTTFVTAVINQEVDSYPKQHSPLILSRLEEFMHSHLAIRFRFSEEEKSE
ncbi:unnamed protein product [Orchesella dallaii]|uniref:Uncharacterized protein n=1 Tax=Orchesella dallaii TaxID=48710 RepID=A0ABP1RW97_9HEXA